MTGKSRTRRKIGTTARARKLRAAGNMSEALLWEELKDRKLGGFKFVRQLPIGPFFADFACRERRLVVEIDGSQHAGNSADRHREAFMQTAGFSTIRFWNIDVVTKITEICDTILAALDGRLTEDVIAPDLRFVRAAKNTPSPAASRPPLPRFAGERKQRRSTP